MNHAKTNKDQSGKAGESFLSTKDIPPRERLIFALDVSSIDEAKALVEQLDDSVMFYKLGLQLFMAGGYFEFIEWLRERGKIVFVDLKFFEMTKFWKRRLSIKTDLKSWPLPC